MSSAPSRHLLLIEGDAYDLELLQHIVGRHASLPQARVARDGEEVLRQFFGDGEYSGVHHSKLPGLIIMNSRLPKISGLEVLKQLKSNSFTSSIPVVMLASNAEDNEILQGYAAGLNAHIEQQVDFRQFTEKVESTCLFWLGLGAFPRASSPLWPSPISHLAASQPASR